MSRPWRWCIAAVMAVTVLGTFLPNALGSGQPAPVSPTVALRAEEPPVAPSGCFAASCGRGAPTPATPTLTLAALFTLAAGASVCLAVYFSRRIRPQAADLPRGSVFALFRPPQFSS